MSNISMDKKYKTRDGLDVRILCVDRHGLSETPWPNQARPVVGMIGPMQTVMCWSSEGKWNDEGDSIYDLIEVKPVKETWINLYKGGALGGTRKSKTECDLTQVNGYYRIGYIKITEEIDGDSEPKVDFIRS